MKLRLASESEPRASTVGNTILKESGQRNQTISIPLTAKKTPPAPPPESVLHLRSISSSSSQISRMNKFSSTSSDDFDNKEPTILTENIGADNDSDSINSPTDKAQNTLLFNEFQRLCQSIEEKYSDNNVEVQELRDMILKYGLPSASGFGFDNISSLRARVWKIVLGVPYALDMAKYQEKSEGCVHEFQAKIKDDSFRTFKGNTEFWHKIKEPELTRVLNAVAVDFGYVQGMNVLLGPFIYIMPEVDSYYCLSALISRHCPKYVSKNLDGVYKGCELLDKCLESLDKELYDHIRSMLTLDVFSVPYIMTLFANMQPLHEVLKLWDAIFAFGVHFVVPLLVTYLMLMRDALLAQKTAYKLKCKITGCVLESELLIQSALGMVQFIPADLFESLMKHPCD